MTPAEAKLLTEAIEKLVINYFETACVPGQMVRVNRNDRRVDYARAHLQQLLQSLVK